jgi:hypothetical protein
MYNLRTWKVGVRGYMSLSKEVVPVPTVSLGVGLLKDSVKRKII